MAKEYIERDALIADLNKFAPEAYNRAADLVIRNQSAADVVEVKHGRWERVFNGDAIMDSCTHCEIALRVHTGKTPDYRYCPYCGARMDGERRANNDR